jgi:hypothetical protein
LDLETCLEGALLTGEYMRHIETVQAERGTIARHWRLQLGCQVNVELPLGIVQAGCDLWGRHTAVYLQNALDQLWPWHRRRKAELIKSEARHIETELDMPVRQGQRATGVYL